MTREDIKNLKLKYVSINFFIRYFEISVFFITFCRGGVELRIWKAIVKHRRTLGLDPDGHRQATPGSADISSTDL